MNEEFDLGAEIAALEREVQAGAEVVELEQEAARQSGSDEWRDIFAGLLGPGFAVLAPNWNIQTDEVKALADAYAPLMAKYFPDASQVGPEIGALFVTVAVIAPRLSTPRKIIEEKPGPDSPGPGKPGKPKPKASNNNVTQLKSERDR